MVCIEIQRSASMIVVCVCGLGEVWVSVEVGWRDKFSAVIICMMDFLS